MKEIIVKVRADLDTSNLEGLRDADLESIQKQLNRMKRTKKGYRVVK